MDEYKAYLDTTSNLQILYSLKRDGLPTTDEELTLLFKKFNTRNNGDYLVHWEDLQAFLPEVEENFGQDRYFQLHKKFDLTGPDIKLSITQSKMNEVDKQFMMFVYEV